jgi:hypothetical protein
MKYFDLYDILMVCNDFVMNPTKKENIEEFNRMTNELIIKAHLSLSQRQAVLLKTLIDIKSDEEMSVAELSKALEISLTFNGILAYVNIDPDFNSVFKDEEMYDLLWLSGFCDIILEKCHADFERLEKQVYAMISFDNLRVMLENLSELDVGNIDALTRAFTEFNFKATPETIKNLAEIARFNDPLIKEFKDELSNKAYETLSKSSDSEEEDEN